MAVVNRTLDATEKRKVGVLQWSNGVTLVGTGVTRVIGIVPWPCTLDAGQIAAFGLSGAPSYELAVNRFIPGSGATAFTIAVGTSNVPPAFGTSGVGISAMILPASGSTLLNLLPNDVLYFVSGVANTAATYLAISLVLNPTQDIKYHFGLGV